MSHKRSSNEPGHHCGEGVSGKTVGDDGGGRWSVFYIGCTERYGNDGDRMHYKTTTLGPRLGPRIR